MTLLTEPFSHNAFTWIFIIIIILGSLAMIDLTIRAFFPHLYPETNYHKILNTLNCDELKDWIKYNIHGSTAQTMYVKKCI